MKQAMIGTLWCRGRYHVASRHPNLANGRRANLPVRNGLGQLLQRLACGAIDRDAGQHPVCRDRDSGSLLEPLRSAGASSADNGVIRQSSKHSR